MTLLYLPRENLFHDIVMAVLFQVHLQEEPIEYSHRERKAELHLKPSSLMVHGFVLTSRLTLDHTPTWRCLRRLLEGFSYSLISSYSQVYIIAIQIFQRAG